ncbi:MAG: hypothetical protein IPJ69_06190 [Deltaproteobacteria bacterium]|nr:MAG: hypothetical protein IPJ69_06190 [Deltaproteobacteria bacterium]
MKFKKIFAGALVVSACLANAGIVKADDIRTVYKVGDGLSIGDGENLVHFQGRVQPRFTATKTEGSSVTDGFTLNRGEFRVDGFVLGKKLKYGLEFNFATTSTKSTATTTTTCTVTGAAEATPGTAPTCVATTTNSTAPLTSVSNTGVGVLNDYYIDWVPTKEFGIQFGQFKVPFLIQQLTSSTKQQFIDRSLTTGFFDFGRDMGANAHGSVLDGKLNYSAFVMNGEGSNSVNLNSQHLMAGTRLEVPVLGTYEYSETDVGNSEDQNLGFGLAYLFNDNGGAATQNSTIARYTRASHGTFDVGYKHRGLSLQGALMLSRAMEGTKLTNWGYNAQAGYFFIPKTLEVAVRQGGTVFSNAVAANTNQYEYAVGMNYFPWQKVMESSFRLTTH